MRNFMIAMVRLLRWCETMTNIDSEEYVGVRTLSCWILRLRRASLVTLVAILAVGP
jgi:hypothetical protein